MNYELDNEKLRHGNHLQKQCKTNDLAALITWANDEVNPFLAAKYAEICKSKNFFDFNNNMQQSSQQLEQMLLHAFQMYCKKFRYKPKSQDSQKEMDILVTNDENEFQTKEKNEKELNEVTKQLAETKENYKQNLNKMKEFDKSLKDFFGQEDLFSELGFEKYHLEQIEQYPERVKNFILNGHQLNGHTPIEMIHDKFFTTINEKLQNLTGQRIMNQNVDDFKKWQEDTIKKLNNGENNSQKGQIFAAIEYKVNKDHVTWVQELTSYITREDCKQLNVQACQNHIRNFIQSIMKSMKQLIQILEHSEQRLEMYNNAFASIAGKVQEMEQTIRELRQTAENNQ